MFDITSTTALAADCLTKKYDTVMLSLTAQIMYQSRLCVSVELTYRVTLGTIISRGSTGTGWSSSSGWAGFSFFTSLSSWALRKNESQICQHEHQIRAIHATLTIAQTKAQDKFVTPTGIKMCTKRALRPLSMALTAEKRNQN